MSRTDGALPGAVSHSILERYAGVVFDLDGVCYRGDRAVEGAAETIEAVRRSGIGVAFATNNAARTPDQIAEKLERLGLPVASEDIVSSALAAARLLEPGTRCLVIGSDGLLSALADRGCAVVDEPAQAQAVVVGFTRDVDWEMLRRATTALLAGADFLGTNGDVSFPASDGLWPGNGAILAALSAATGRKPRLAGKPDAALFEAAAARLPSGDLLMVGDRLETDIAGATALGWDTALVLTGVSTAAMAAEADPAPTYVVETVRHLLDPAG